MKYFRPKLRVTVPALEISGVIAEVKGSAVIIDCDGVDVQVEARHVEPAPGVDAAEVHLWDIRDEVEMLADRVSDVPRSEAKETVSLIRAMLDKVAEELR